MTNLNKLLQRQISKHFGASEHIPDVLQSFLKVISDTYDHHEKDRKMLERSIEISSDEMKELNNNLRKQKAHLEASQEMAHVGSWEFNITDSGDSGVNAWHWSDETFRIFGLEKGPVISDHLFFSQVHQEDLQLVYAAYRQAIETGASYVSEHRIVLPDGVQKTIREQAEVIMNEKTGKPVKLVGTVQDITEKQQAAQQIKDSEYKFRTLIENSTDAIVILSPAGQPIYTSPSIQKVVGYTEEELPNLDMFSLTHPDDMPGVHRLFEKVLASPGMAVKGYARRMRHKDGTWHWYESVVTNMLHDPVINGIVDNFRDITDTVLAEKQLMDSYREVETLLDNIDEIFLTLDRNLNIVSFNEKARIAGEKYLAKEIKKGASFLDFAEPDRIDYLRSVYADVLTGKKRQTELVFNLDNGEQVYFLTLLKPIFNKTGGIDGIFVIERDITETVIKQKQIEFNQNNLNALVNSTADLMWSVDRNYKLITSNQAFDAMVLYMSGKPVNRGENVLVNDGFSELQLTRFEELYRRAFAGEVFSVTQYSDTPEPLWSDISFYPIREGNEVIGTACYSHNITEQKLARQKEEEKERRYRALVENSSDAIIILTATGKPIYVSSSIERVLGYSEDETMLLDMQSIKHPDELINEQRTMEQVLANPGMVITGYISQMLHKDGTWHWYEASFKNMLDDPSINGIIKNFRDITERKKAKEALEHSEHRFRALIENSHDGISLVSAGGKFTYIAPSVKRIMGYEYEELIGMDPAGFTHPEDLEYVVGALMTLIPQYGATQALTYRMRHKNGSWRTLKSNITNMLHEPAVQAIVFNYEDVTDKVLAEEKIVNANRLYAFISQINQTIVHAENELTVFSNACRIAIEYGKFKMAWIGLFDKERKKINMVEGCGIPAGDEHLFINAAYDNNGPQDHVLRTGSSFICNDIENDLELPSWKLYAAMNKLGSCMVLPIKKAGTIIGTLNLYASEKHLFDEQEVVLLEEVAGDISFSLDFFEKEALRELMEKQLRHSELRLRQAQSISHFGNWELDFSTGKAIWSDEACKIYGLAPENNIQSYDAWISFIHPDDLEEVVKVIKEAQVSLCSSAFYHRIIRTDGVVRYLFSQTEFDIDDTGKPVGLHGVAHDVTEIRESQEALAQSEANLRLIMDLIPQSIFVKNFHGEYLFVNSSFAKLYDLSPKELLLKSTMDRITIAEEGNAFLKQDQEVILTGATKIIPELTFTRPNGEQRFFYTVKVPYSPAGKNEKGVLGIALDITEQKNAELEKAKMIADIVQRNKDLEQFSYIISHNLRAPVANILGLAEVIQFTDPNTLPPKELIDALSVSTQKLDAVIKDLNYILQVKHELNEKKELVRFTELLEDIKISIKNLINSESVEIISDFSQVNEMPALKSYLYSIFFNLVSNSIKYRRHDIHSIIEITSIKLENKIELVFKDNGLGIDLEKENKYLFGLYKRFHSHVEGKGMGLYMVKTQVEAMGGRISINSAINCGTAFRIEFNT